MFKQTLLLTLTICAAALLSISQPAYGQLNELKLNASDAAAGDDFGWWVSISGDYAVIGARFDDDNGINAGSAYVFKRSGKRWIQETHLLASDGATGDQFGRSVSISGDYVVVGARYNDENGINAGSAYVFKRNDTAWIQEAHLLPLDGAANQFFGSSVSISGDYVLSGAFQDDDNGFFSGSAYVFKRTGESWAEEAKLLSSDGVTFDGFGISVAISGDYALVGAWGEDDNGSKSGAVYVFKRTGTSWAEEAKLLPSDGEANDWFGSSVAISGDYAIVGAWGDDDNGSSAGSAYLFRRTGTSWAEEAKLLPSDGAADYFFGFPVSISGEHVVVGAVGDGSGAVYVFKRTGTSWVQEIKLHASDGEADDSFGHSVSISDDYVIVGAFADDDHGTDAGSVYIYTGFTSPVSVGHERAGLPAEFSLFQNYPNPFNPETMIEYALPEAGEVSLIVYNLRGEEVAHLINDNMPAGNHRVSWDASKLSSGIYFYRIQTADFVQTRKMVLLK